MSGVLCSKCHRYVAPEHVCHMEITPAPIPENTITIEQAPATPLADRLEENWSHIREFFASRNWPDTTLGRAASDLNADIPRILRALRAPQEGQTDELPKVAVGQTWKECDPRVTRMVKVVGIYGDKVALRGTQTNRLSYASKSRFHGRSGGYAFVSATPQPAIKC